MLAWKDWSRYAGGQEEDVPFSCLQHLVVRGCHSLVRTLPGQLDLLKKLEIHSCPHLNSSTNVVCLPSLCELSLEDCNEKILKILVNLTSLTVLRIKNLAELVCLDHGFTSYLVKLKKLYIGQCGKLEHLWQNGNEMQYLACLQSVVIYSCGMLNYLWQNGNEMQNLTCLQSVVIDSCPQFTFFVVGDREMELSCNLEKMELRNCTSLQKLPSKMYTLRDLKIENCPKIMGLIISQDDPSNNNLIPQLEFLKISECDSLISFSFAKGRLTSLKELSIEKCEGVESLKEIIAESLDYLFIERCENLVSLPRCLHTLSHLTWLNLVRCPALEIEDFPPLPITLVRLVLWSLPKMKSLPKEWHHLTSLRWLSISGCENIKCLPEGGLPPNLQEFSIKKCENMMQRLREWGLPMLTSLEQLLMEGNSMGGEGDKVWFPAKEDDEDAWSLLFPSSLTELHLRDMRNVESLSSGIRNHLSSLQQLWIEDCPKLKYLPQDGLPPSLQYLWIENCENLKYLPEDGLPPSLQGLDIEGCENLKDRCSKHSGDYWPLIQDIPLINIDNVRIQ